MIVTNILYKDRKFLRTDQLSFSRLKSFGQKQSYRGSYGGNKMAETSDVRSRFRRSSKFTGRNVTERRVSLEKKR